MGEELCRKLATLRTEQRNPRSNQIDTLSTEDILYLINEEDAKVAAAVRRVIPQIARAVDIIVDAFQHGGRLFYIGAGTSGRLGILDAAECPPTFGTPTELIQGIIAGGYEAVFRAQEGAEDREEEARQAIADHGVTEKDVLCGLAASGRTPFVKAAIEEAQRRGARTILITTNSSDKVQQFGIHPDIIICPDVGPEVIAGSTRMKSATAQKMILTMLSTTAMIKMGKVYGNVMVDLQMTSEKLRERAHRIVMEIAHVDYDTASEALIAAKGHVKTALVMLLGKCDYQTATQALQHHNGFVRYAIEAVQKRNMATQ